MEANELLRVLDREVFDQAIDILKLPYAIGLVIDFAHKFANKRAGLSTQGTNRDEVLEEAAKVAEYHHSNHCENRDTFYRNCGSAIAIGIRDLKSENGAQGTSEAGRSSVKMIGQLKFEIDGETKWLLRDGVRFVSTEATECEMVLWAALKDKE